MIGGEDLTKVGRKPRRFGWLRPFVLHPRAPGLSHVSALSL